jgi:hypothetical protein
MLCDKLYIQRVSGNVLREMYVLTNKPEGSYVPRSVRLEHNTQNSCRDILLYIHVGVYP